MAILVMHTQGALGFPRVCREVRQDDRQDTGRDRHHTVPHIRLRLSLLQPTNLGTLDRPGEVDGAGREINVPAIQPEHLPLAQLTPCRQPHHHPWVGGMTWAGSRTYSEVETFTRSLAVTFFDAWWTATPGGWTGETAHQSCSTSHFHIVGPTRHAQCVCPSVRLRVWPILTLSGLVPVCPPLENAAALGVGDEPVSEDEEDHDFELRVGDRDGAVMAADVTELLQPLLSALCDGGAVSSDVFLALFG